MAAGKLQIYNLALAHLQERKLASLTENREPRRVLDDLWDQEIAYCLERKRWNFLFRTVQIDASSQVTPAFGYLYAFPIPEDWIRTSLLSAVPTLNPPLLQVKEEAGYWYANVTPIYVQYNSSDPAYGMDLSRWPASFVDYVSLRLAAQACGRIAGKADLAQGAQGLLKREQRACTVASANCAMNDAIGFAPMSSWVRSRRGAMGFGGPGGDDPTGGALVP